MGLPPAILPLRAWLLALPMPAGGRLDRALMWVAPFAFLGVGAMIGMAVLRSSLGVPIDASGVGLPAAVVAVVAAWSFSNFAHRGLEWVMHVSFRLPVALVVFILLGLAVAITASRGTAGVGWLPATFATAALLWIVSIVVARASPKP